MATITINAISQDAGSQVAGGFLKSPGGTVYINEHDGTGIADNDNQAFEVGQIFDVNYLIYRSGLSFDTSGLGVGATITDGTLSVYGWSDFSDTDFNLTIVSGSDLAVPLVDADYQELLNDTTSFGTMSTSGFVGSNWNNIPLSSAGIAAINKTGTTHFGLRSSRDIGTITPTGYESIQYETSWIETYPNTHRPKITINYTTGFIPKVFIM